MITSSAIQALMPKASWVWALALPEAMDQWDINTIDRQSEFLAQIAHESAGLTRFEESLYYTDPERVARIFRTAFDLDKDNIIDPEEIEFAKAYVRNPEKLANRCYANRLGNGPESSGDGYKYRGRGPIQITGFSNYRAAEQGCGVQLVAFPELAIRAEPGSVVCCYLWHSFGCNSLADRSDTTTITRKINGPALLGLAERKQYAMHARQILNG